MATYREPIGEQLASTAGHDALAAHRELVQNRWDQLRSLALPDQSPSKLSPNSKTMKKDFFEGDKLSAQMMKNFKKKCSGLFQSLTNASDRLNEVQREESP